MLEGKSVDLKGAKLVKQILILVSLRCIQGIQLHDVYRVQ